MGDNILQLTKDISNQMLRPAPTQELNNFVLAKIEDTTYLSGGAKHSDIYILVEFHKLSPECFSPT